MHWAQKSLINPLLQLLAPRQCAACLSALPMHAGSGSLCFFCEDEMPWVNEDALGLVPENMAYTRLAGRLPLQHAESLLFYRAGTHARSLIFNMKYHDGQEACLAMGQLLGQRLLESFSLGKGSGHGRPDIICYVPMHPAKEKIRGYNQAALLAQGVAHATGLPVSDVLLKTVSTQSQTKMDRTSRALNLEGVFAVAPNITLPPHILLIDDVLTTGATIEQACHPLLQAGVQYISIGVVAVVE